MRDNSGLRGSAPIMAVSPAHRLGQIIGDQVEAAVHEALAAIAKEYNLYLDYRHSRKARGNKKRVKWTDWKGNSHILDYVIEEGGSEAVQGRPRAFIEIAWRRYTKHSKNKAQEIQGAITPLAETHQDAHPFLGAVLAGEFTEASIEQFKSHGFQVIHCSYETVLDAFASEGIDVSSEEDTTDEILQEKVDAYERLSLGQQEQISVRIRELHSEQFETFLESLLSSLKRRVEFVLVLPLYGTQHQFEKIQDAVNYIANYDPSTPSLDFVKYELNVRYSNGDEIRGTFHEKDRAIEFLNLHSS